MRNAGELIPGLFIGAFILPGILYGVGALVEFRSLQVAAGLLMLASLAALVMIITLHVLKSKRDAKNAADEMTAPRSQDDFTE